MIAKVLNNESAREGPITRRDRQLHRQVGSGLWQEPCLVVRQLSASKFIVLLTY